MKQLQITLVMSLTVFAFLLYGTGCNNDLPSKPNIYQAVFLNNGQVYYGIISDSQGQFYTLEDVYYVLKQNPKEEGGQPQLSLVKMGKEFHGPEDLIYINRDQIVYVENLKPKGEVVLKIEEHKKQLAVAKQPGNAVAPTQGQATAPAQGQGQAAGNLSPQEMEQFKKFQQYQQMQESMDNPSAQPGGSAAQAPKKSGN